jgi:ABC-type cobalamin/Fe3+-siderophores transport system ATPase subunit
MEQEIVFEGVSFRYPDGNDDIFAGLDLQIPRGIVSLVGQNGTGKSTLLLLASGRLVPTQGKVLIRGHDTRDLQNEAERQELVSFIYQNMEFDTEEPIGRLLSFVYENGLHTRGRKDPVAERMPRITVAERMPRITVAERMPRITVAELVEVFELAPILGRRTQEVSKGELQRTILAFSLLYGSPLIAMDEPIFALESHQKQKAMDYLARRARQEEMGLYYSVHELDISQKYSDYILLFSREAAPRLGRTSEIFTRETIEKAFEVPFDMLKKREELYRKYLVELLRVRGEG